MKNSVLVKALFYLAVALFASVAIASGAHLASASQPILSSNPEQSLWIADGVTEYTIVVSGDSTPMEGIGTRGIQFAYLLNAPGYIFTFKGINWEPSNDFFEGYGTINNMGGNMVSRSLNSAGNGPVNKQGNVASLRFTVAPTANAPFFTKTSLKFDSNPLLTYFRRPTSQGGGTISPILQSTQFTVSLPNIQVGSVTRIGTAGSAHSTASQGCINPESC